MLEIKAPKALVPALGKIKGTLFSSHRMNTGYVIGVGLEQWNAGRSSLRPTGQFLVTEEYSTNSHSSGTAEQERYHPRSHRKSTGYARDDVLATISLQQWNGDRAFLRSHGAKYVFPELTKPKVIVTDAGCSGDLTQISNFTD